MICHNFQSELHYTVGKSFGMYGVEEVNPFTRHRRHEHKLQSCDLKSMEKKKDESFHDTLLEFCLQRNKMKFRSFFKHFFDTLKHLNFQYSGIH